MALRHGSVVLQPHAVVRTYVSRDGLLAPGPPAVSSVQLAVADGECSSSVATPLMRMTACAALARIPVCPTVMQAAGSLPGIQKPPPIHHEHVRMRNFHVVRESASAHSGDKNYA